MERVIINLNNIIYLLLSRTVSYNYFQNKTMFKFEMCFLLKILPDYESLIHIIYKAMI